MGNRHPPRRFDSRLSAGHTHAAQVRRPPEFPVISNQEFAAPNGPVGAETCAVEADADHRLIEPMFGHAACHMGVMMLHGNTLAALFSASAHSVARRGIIGVQIVNNHTRLNREGSLIELDVTLKSTKGLEMIQ